MQRVSAFLPAWERRNSATNKSQSTPSSPGSPDITDITDTTDTSETTDTTDFTTSTTTPALGPPLITTPTTTTPATATTSTTSTSLSTIIAATATAITDTARNNHKKNSSSSNFSTLFRWSHRSSASVKTDTLGSSLDVHRVHRERFWPSTLDIECDKAARILKSFCVDGFLTQIEHDDQPQSPSSAGPKTPVKFCGRIPKRIIQNAAGIAVFSCMRSGLWMTGSGGSGILIARKSDGTWSPPSGIMLHTPTLSFIIGVDIYDCVLVVSSFTALEAVTAGRVNLGNEIELRSGQTVPLYSDESDVNWKDLGDSVQTYMKARGQQQFVDMNGCILTERSNENERFYYADVTQMEILSGSVAKEVEETTPLFEVIKMAEGRTDFDPSIINKVTTEPAPSDAIISTPQLTPTSPQRPFGIVKVDDPDPFGVLALEMAGLEIREAGSRMRPTSSMIDVKMSPIFSAFGRRSMGTLVSQSDRASITSTRTLRSQPGDYVNQTDAGLTPETTPSPNHSDGFYRRVSSAGIPEEDEEEEEEEEEENKEEKEDADQASEVEVAKEVDDMTTPVCPLNSTILPAALSVEPCAAVEDDDEKTADSNSIKDHREHAMSDVCEPEDEDHTNDADDEDDINEDEEEEEGDDHESDEEEGDEEGEGEEDEEGEGEEEEEVVVFEVAAVQPARTQAVASRMIQARGNVVTIAKRVPPPLPRRSPARMSRVGKPEVGDRSSLRLSTNESDWADRRESTDSNINEIEPAEQAKVKVEFDETATEESEKRSSTHEMGAAAQPHAELRDQELVDAEVNTEGHLRDEPLLNESHLDAAENSDSAFNKKHTSSIYTGITEDRWSFDGSSVTTPISERRFSMLEEKVTEDTPKRVPSEEMEKPAIRASSSSLHELMMHSPIVAMD